LGIRFRELPDAAFMFCDKANPFVAYALGGWLAASALRVSRSVVRIAAGTAETALLGHSASTIMRAPPVPMIVLPRDCLRTP